MTLKIYGPYKRPDGRSHICIVDTSSGKRTTQSYPRYLMEQQLGKKLEEWEHIDHKDNDPTNNKIENLQILTQAENNKKSARPVEMYEFICPVCKNTAVKPASKVRHNRSQGKAGPYCSKRCAGKNHN